MKPTVSLLFVVLATLLLAGPAHASATARSRA
jgi:hypothetical protein